MKRIWIDEHHEDGEQRYETRKEALDVIREIIKTDDSHFGVDASALADNMTDDDVFDRGYLLYGIYEKEVESTPCCDKQDLQYDIDGRTDGISYETWTCANCETHYNVPIEIVRDWDNIEEIK